jgi:hypothetical protein
MAKPSLGAVLAAVPDPLLSDNFQLAFPNVPTGDNSIPLLMQCKTAIKPGFTINNVEVQLFGHTVEHAGNKTFSHDLSVEYVENRMLQIHDILEGWGNLIRGTQTQHGAFKADYARDGYLTVFDQMGNTVKEYVIVNCWPSVVPDDPFDGTAANVISMQISFKYDYYYDKSKGIGA